VEFELASDFLEHYKEEDFHGGLQQGERVAVVLFGLAISAPFDRAAGASWRG
jgi:hypothetical protein